jgi:hypothetical protein
MTPLRPLAPASQRGKRTPDDYDVTACPLFDPCTPEMRSASARRECTLPSYLAAPPSNHAASFARSSSVMCVTLPIGIVFSCTACT